MASLRGLAFDHEGRVVQFDTWLDDLQLYLLSNSKDSVSLFDLAAGAATAPPATSDSTTRSQWLTHDAAARLAIRNHLPLAKCAHFGQHRTAQALYDAVVARYSSPATAALGRPLLPYLFPELSAFATVEDLVSHLRTSDARYRAAVHTKFLTGTRPRFAVRAALGTPRPPFFEGCSPSPLTPSYASAAAANVSVAEDVRAASSSAKRRSSKGKGGRGGGGGSGGGGGGNGSGGGGSSGGGGGSGTVGGSGRSGGGGGGSGGSGGSGGGGTGGGGTGARRVGSGGGQRQQQQCQGKTPSPQIAIFDLDFDAFLSAMYALSVSAEGDCYRCVPPDQGIAATDLGASESGTLPGTAPAEAFHTFTLDSGASRCQVAASCSCRLLSHQTLLWLHRLGHPSLPRLRGSHSRLLVSSLPRSLPPLPPSPAPPCLPFVEGRLRATPHSLFPPTTAPLQTLHMYLWGPTRVSGQSRERYFLLVVDDYTRYTTVFPLRSKGQVVDVLIPWIRTVHLQLRERFGQDLPIMHLHSDRGGEFSSNLLRDFCRGEGILQSFTLPDSPQRNGIAERRTGLVMEVARTSMTHAAAPHFLWLFAVQYAAHLLNLWPRVSLPETSPTLRWTGEVGNTSVFRIWGSRAFVRDTSADKLSPRAIPCVFLGFVPDAPNWQFYHPPLRRVFLSHDVTFDESVPFYHPLPPQGLAPSGVSQVDPLLGPAPVQVAVDSGAARGDTSKGATPGGAEPGGAEPGGVETRGAEPGGVVTGGAEPGGAEPEGVKPGGAASEGAESGGAEPMGTASSGGSAGASPSLSPQQLREWFVRHTRLRSGASGAGGAGPARVGGPRVAVGAGVTGGAATTNPGGARTRVGGPGAGGAGVGGPDVGGAGAGGAGAVDPCGAPASPLLAPSPYTEQSGGLTERREPASRPLSPVRTARRIPRSRPPPVLGTHAMTLRPSSIPLRVPLSAPPESSLLEVPDPESHRARVASPTISRLLATAVSDPSFESYAASALVAELLDFAAACHLDYATALVVESASTSPPSVGGECALGMDVLEDRQEDFECLAAAVPPFASMLLAPEGDPDAPDIPAPRSYAEAITGPYSTQWQAAMDAEMASWKSTGTYVDEVPPPGVNIVDGMWIFRVKRPPGSPPAFKARYVARGFNQRQGVDYFHTFSPTPKMTTLWMLLHVATQRTQWSLRRPVYGLRQAPREWHDTLRTTLAALGFALATAYTSLFLRTDTSLQPFYIDDLIFATADTEALTLVKLELQKRHTCTDLGELRSYLGLQITQDRARRTITLTQSHIVHQVLQRFGFQFSSPQPTPLSTSHSLSAPPSDESVEPSGP
ncbi:unnamed protein product [Closterium sp. NIES-53]